MKTNTTENFAGLEIQNISLVRNNKTLYKNFSHFFEPSLIHGILGPSGSGKTSLLHAIAGLIPINDGTIQGGNAISYVFQEPRLFPWLSVEKNLSIVIEKKSFSPVIKDAKIKRNIEKQIIKDKVYEMLKKVRLLDYAKSYPTEISGGEKQRLALARAFLFPSSVLLMDEAFQSQDIVLKLELMDLLQHLHEEDKRTIIMVSHDIREALSIADSLLVLKGRPIQKEFAYCIRHLNEYRKKASEIYVDFPKDLQERENEILQAFSNK